MIADIFGVTTWPVAVIVAVIALVWAFNVHSDRENRHELDRLIVAECADEESPSRCAKQILEAL